MNIVSNVKAEVETEKEAIDDCKSSDTTLVHFFISHSECTKYSYVYCITSIW